MVGDDPALLFAQDPVFLLFTDKDKFHCLEEIFLGDSLTTVLDRIDRCLVHHIRKVRTDGAGSRKGDLLEVYRLIQTHILRMYFQNAHTTFQVRLIDDDTPVKTTRS